MDELEAREQLRALEELVATYSQDHRFTAEDICNIHEDWLGSIYLWAGEYRLVNISKENFFRRTLQANKRENVPVQPEKDPTSQ